MCFVIDPKHPDKKIAKRDIPCYKVLYNILGELTSPYRFCTYVLNEFKIDVIGDPINVSFRSIINQGLHSYSSKKELRKIWDDNSIYKSIIPKGSEYYYNSKEKEYVSNQLIVIEKL